MNDIKIKRAGHFIRMAEEKMVRKFLDGKNSRKTKNTMGGRFPEGRITDPRYMRMEVMSWA